MEVDDVWHECMNTHISADACSPIEQQKIPNMKPASQEDIQSLPCISNFCSLVFTLFTKIIHIFAGFMSHIFVVTGIIKWLHLYSPTYSWSAGVLPTMLHCFVWLSQTEHNRHNSHSLSHYMCCYTFWWCNIHYCWHSFWAVKPNQS